MNTTTTTAQTDIAPARKPYLIILQSGIVTSAIALAGVYFLNKTAEDVNIMGWYANYVIPIGAIIVGLIAGSGYGLASWWTGAKISRGLLLVVLLLQTASYVVAEYMEYRDVRNMIDTALAEARADGEVIDFTPPTFVEYYRAKAEGFAWKAKTGDGEGEALGNWGYLFVGLGALGFIAGGAIAPAVLMSKPYCDRCQTYKKTRALGLLPASIPERKPKKADTAGRAQYDSEQAQAMADGDDRIEAMKTLANAGDGKAFTDYLATFVAGKKETGKLPRRVQTELVYCDTCRDGELVHSIIAGKGDKTTTERLVPVPVSATFVNGVVAK